MIFRKPLVLAVAICLAPVVYADGIPVTPGLWETTMTMEMPMLPQPRVTTTNQCWDQTELNMDEIATEGMDPNCTWDMQQVDGQTMKWSFECPVEGGTSRGDWEATSLGKTATGKGVMTVSFSGQTMKMNMSWEAKHIGDCP